MTYKVVVAPSAARQLSARLSETVAAAVVEFLFGALAEEPHRVGAPLRAPYDGFYRARRGEYRVRYRIDDKTETVNVVDIGHRRDIYRPGR